MTCILFHFSSRYKIVKTYLLMRAYALAFTKKAEQGRKKEENTIWSLKIALSLSFIVFIYWLVFLLILAGDVHPNPGPLTPQSLSSSNLFIKYFNST